MRSDARKRAERVTSPDLLFVLREHGLVIPLSYMDDLACRCGWSTPVADDEQEYREHLAGEIRAWVADGGAL